jgi:hypothetical protein
MRSSRSITRPMMAPLMLALAVCLPHTASAQAGQPPTVWPDEGPATWTQRETEPAITANDLRTHVYQLAADSMMGRQAATRGNWMATDYIADVFERLGLQPAGEDGYFQELEFGPLSFDRDSIRLVVDGRALEPGVEWVPFSPSQQSGITGDFSVDAAPVVFGGDWTNGSTSLPAGDLRDRVVVFAVPDPTTAVLRLRDTEIQAAAPASILLVVPGMIPETALQERTGLLAEVSGTAMAQLTPEAAAGLFDQPLSELTAGDAGRPLTASWHYAYHRPEYPARNVIAVLPGSDPELRGQYVLVGAHNDHVGTRTGAPVDHDALRAFNRVMRPQGANDRPGPPTPEQQARIDSLTTYARSIRQPFPDSIMNGADDDASGTAILLDIAERFATGQPPGRSIVFISHNAEEAGLLGSRYFTENPTLPLDSIVAAHNMDMLGKGRVTDVKFGGAAQVQMLGARRLSQEFGDVIDSLNAVRDETMAIDYSWDRTNALNRFCRSDQVNYFRHTIPVTYFSTGYSIDYHQPTDEPRYVDFEHSARVGRFVYDIMRTIADRPTRLRVLPLEERDLSAQCTR